MICGNPTCALLIVAILFESYDFCREQQTCQLITVLVFKKKKHLSTELLYRSIGLFLCISDLHGMRWSDLESLESISSSPCLILIFKLHEGDVVAPRHQAHFFESRKPLK